MITEFMESGSLFDLIHKNKDREKILTDERIFSICEDVALGMNYLHSRKVLHCDLKSSNVLVFFLILKVDDNWNMKLCDFGLSRVKNKIHKKKTKVELELHIGWLLKFLDKKPMKNLAMFTHTE